MKVEVSSMSCHKREDRRQKRNTFQMRRAGACRSTANGSVYVSRKYETRNHERQVLRICMVTTKLGNHHRRKVQDAICNNMHETWKMIAGERNTSVV